VLLRAEVFPVHVVCLPEDAVYVSGFGRGNDGILELGVVPQVIAVLLKCLTCPDDQNRYAGGAS
jgi:hypothetical protein